jgi:hypothetical protein
LEKKVDKETSSKISSAENIRYEGPEQLSKINMPEKKLLRFYKNGNFILQNLDNHNLENDSLANNFILLKEPLKDSKNSSNGSLICFFDTKHKSEEDKSKHRAHSTERCSGIVTNHEKVQDYIDFSFTCPDTNLRDNYSSKRSLSASRISLNNNNIDFKEFELFYKKRLEVETIL